MVAPKTLLVLLVVAILRGCASHGLGLGIEPWLANRYPSLPPLVCMGISAIIGVLVVEVIAFAIEALIARIRGKPPEAGCR